MYCRDVPWHNTVEINFCVAKIEGIQILFKFLDSEIKIIERFLMPDRTVNFIITAVIVIAFWCA